MNSEFRGGEWASGTAEHISRDQILGLERGPGKKNKYILACFTCSVLYAFFHIDFGEIISHTNVNGDREKIKVPTRMLYIPVPFS